MNKNSLIDNNLVDFWLNHLNHIQEQLRISPEFALHGYVKKEKINHNIVAAMKNLGFIKQPGRGKYSIERAAQFNSEDSLAVITELKKISKTYHDSLNIKKKNNTGITLPNTENAPVNEPPVNNCIDSTTMLQFLQSEIVSKNKTIEELMNTITVKNDYITHLQESNTNLISIKS